MLSIIALAIVVVASIKNNNRSDFHWNGISENVKDSVIRLEDEIYIVGRAGTLNKTKQKELQKWVIENSSMEMLQRLTNYPNSMVAITAYEGLISSTTGKERIEFIKEGLKKNHQKVFYTDGHYGDATTLDSFLIWEVLRIQLPSQPPIPDEVANYYELNDYDLSEIINFFETK